MTITNTKSRTDRGAVKDIAEGFADIHEEELEIIAEDEARAKAEQKEEEERAKQEGQFEEANQLGMDYLVADIVDGFIEFFLAPPSSEFLSDVYRANRLVARSESPTYFSNPGASRFGNGYTEIICCVPECADYLHAVNLDHVCRPWLDVRDSFLVLLLALTINEMNHKVYSYHDEFDDFFSPDFELKYLRSMV